MHYQKLRQGNLLMFPKKNQELLTPWEVRAFRRVFDIIFALIGIIIAVPVLLYLSPKAREETGLSAIYWQKRCVGKGRFLVPKLRTMDKNGYCSPACIKWRKWKLDELYQFFLVLFGVISMVGLRPLRTCEEARMLRGYPEWHPVHRAKRGITGESGLCQYDRATQHMLYGEFAVRQAYAQLSLFTYAPFYFGAIFNTILQMASGTAVDKNGVSDNMIQEQRQPIAAE